MNYRPWIVALYYANILLATIYIAVVYFRPPLYFLRRAFDMDGEGTFFSWYSSGLLLLSALCWFFQLEFLRKPLDRYVAAVAALTFSLLSMDESISLHEAASRVMQKASGSPFEASGPLFLLGIPMLVLGYFVWRRWPWPGRPAFLLFGGTAIMVASACGIEASINYIEYDSALFKFEVLLEETGEMMGMTTILLGSYDHLKERIAEGGGVEAATHFVSIE